MLVTLDLSAPGAEAILESFDGHPTLIERLQEVGFVPGEKIRFARKLLFGEPFIVEVRGIQVALRKEEVRCMRVKLL
jgi:Fe2+ transport system protein FeoA